MTRHRLLTSLAALLASCANAQFVEPIDGDEDEPMMLNGLGPSGGAAGKGTASLGTGGKPATGTAGRAGSSSGHSSGGKALGGAADDAGEAGDESGGKAGIGGSASAGAGGQAGSLNQPAMCDEASATVLGTMSSNVTVASNVCLKMSLPADQTWIKKITMQPEGGTYPLPFTWSNCGTNSSGAFSANYANQILTPLNLQCPVLVKLGGNGSPVNVQWWGG